MKLTLYLLKKKFFFLNRLISFNILGPFNSLFTQDLKKIKKKFLIHLHLATKVKYLRRRGKREPFK
jgi:hypothetical protein